MPNRSGSVNLLLPSNCQPLDLNLITDYFVLETGTKKPHWAAMIERCVMSNWFLIRKLHFQLEVSQWPIEIKIDKLNGYHMFFPDILMKIQQLCSRVRLIDVLTWQQTHTASARAGSFHFPCTWVSLIVASIQSYFPLIQYTGAPKEGEYCG